MIKGLATKLYIMSNLTFYKTLLCVWPLEIQNRFAILMMFEMMFLLFTNILFFLSLSFPLSLCFIIF